MVQILHMGLSEKRIPHIVSNHFATLNDITKCLFYITVLNVYSTAFPVYPLVI
jgi:hypothetical protein